MGQVNQLLSKGDLWVLAKHAAYVRQLRGVCAATTRRLCGDCTETVRRLRGDCVGCVSAAFHVLISYASVDHN